MYAGGGVTIVIPTYDEAENMGPLLRAIQKALPQDNTRILFIDDSPDKETILAIEEASSESSNLEVDFYHREGKELWGGLAGSVVDGFHRAQGVAVVMDGDLQHPPSTIPDMLASMDGRSDALIVASRYCRGGSNNGLSGPVRRFVSWASIRLAKAFFPVALRGVSDPMSGFFALHLEAIDLNALRPQGFKILLEVLARNPHLKKGEVPLAFGARQAGKSKGNLRQGIVYLKHLMRLRMSTVRNRLTYKHVRQTTST